MHRLGKKYLFLKDRKAFILISVFLFLGIVVSTLFLSAKHSTNEQGTADVKSGTWEITVAYKTETKKLELKKLQLLSEKINSDSRTALFSPYTLSVIGKSNTVLYSSPVFIATEYIFSIYAGSRESPGFSSFSQDVPPVLPRPPAELETVLYAPLIADSSEMVIKNDGKQELSINLPGITGISQSSKIAQSVCGPLQVVFMSDGYTDFQKFHQDVERLKQTFLSADPYTKKPNMFDFKTVDNAQSLGCMQSLGCIRNPDVPRIGRQAFPQASKFIVIADISYNNPPQGAALGVINGIGGNVMAFPRSAYVQGRELVNEIAVHEFLGHGVGFLYDRYVVKNNTQSVKRNCSNNPAGESFWSAAGVTQTYPGCFAESRFAPTPNDCTTPGHPTLVSGGSLSSVMSAGGCGATQFDTVEKYWIENYIFPKYSSCSDPTTTLRPTMTNSPSVSPTGVVVCNPDGVGGIDFADLRLARREIAGIASTSHAACMTGGQSTVFADLRKIRRIIAGLE